jgi:hypothetical protein
LPKVAGFNVRGGMNDRVLEEDMGFPGHQDDNICIDEQGRAVYFIRFIGM